MEELLVVSQDTSAYGVDIRYRTDRWRGRRCGRVRRILALRLVECCKGRNRPVKCVGMKVGWLAPCLFVCGCSSVLSSVTESLATDLSSAILDNEDVAVVRDGAPAYLIMLDALLRSAPDNRALLTAAATLNGAYATAFVADASRRQAFADKALRLATRAACPALAWTCRARAGDREALAAALAQLSVRDVPLAYAFATAWAGWIQAHSSDWKAIAEFGRVQAVMERIAELDEGHESGGPRMYLGVFETVLPPALGGRPEVGRAHFERAIELSNGRYLMARVLFAERYARLVFDRELHDAQLHTVLAANPRQEGLTLVNLVAQEQARVLLSSADEYF